jgi:hypothetical protein
MMISHNTDGARAFQYDPAELRKYAQSVYANTDAFPSNLRPADLANPIDLSAMGDHLGRKFRVLARRRWRSRSTPASKRLRAIRRRCSHARRAASSMSQF